MRYVKALPWGSRQRFVIVRRYKAMAEINKLSAGQVLDKLRKQDASEPGFSALDDKIKKVEEETRQMRAARRRFAIDTFDSPKGK
jgi:hypothetical protein